MISMIPFPSPLLNFNPINPNPSPTQFQTNQLTQPKRIPTTTLPTGKTIQDWDCSSAIDIPFLTASLSYVRDNGSLPPRLRSKEDQNEATESGVSEEVVTQLRRDVQTRLSNLMGGRKNRHSGTGGGEVVVAFLEGFLLYAPPSPSSPFSSPPQEEREGHALRDVHALIDLRLFLPAPYDLVKRRRENRSGYVTIGPAPASAPKEEGSTEEKNGGEVDLEGEDDRPPQNFWTDPPGYVDDIVWPRYVQDHAWLLLPEGGSESGQRSADCLGAGPQCVVKLVGQGVNVKTDAGVTVAPGQGNLPMVDILQWAVDEVMKHLEQVAY